MYPALRGFAMDLNLGPNLRAGVFGMKLGVLAQQFLGTLVLDLRRVDGDLHDLIAARSGARVRHALLAEPELLAVLGALRNLQEGAAVDGGHLDLGAEARFIDPHRHGDFDIVSVAAEKGVRIHAHRDVQIARRCAQRAGVPLAGHAQAGTLLRPGRNSHLDGFLGGDAAIAMAGRAVIAQPSRALALGTGEAEAHRARHLRHGPASIALRANRIGAGPRAAAGAGGADFLAGDLEPHLGALDGLPEIDAQPVFEIGAFLGRAAGALLLAPEPLAEDIVEAGGSAGFRGGRAAS